MSSTHRILLLGAGELGTAFLPHLSALPNTHITIAVRSISKYTHLSGPNVTLLGLDTTGPSLQLSEIFSRYDTVISCTGFGQPIGTVTKLAHEILDAGKIRREAGKEKLWFFPWQWGVDYDITKNGDGLMPLFGEQLNVRHLLREKASASHVKWTIVSTGLFMSMLFAPYWGVVEQQDDRIKVRALKDWDHKITVTDVADIGKALARIITGDVDSQDRILYVAADTLSYSQLAETIENISGKKVEREKWSLLHLNEELEKDPNDDLKKYRVVFAKDGVWWDKEITVNQKLGIHMTTVKDYLEQLLK
ncbi:hypothetical protein B0J11DRAFT_154712 [Dendryphion nanum]|uniref:NmrA-like domain-containing protein n=1 Tax=Dendryphion nanum TaxID=256645 RepID=A0A9P9EDK9_9PLEO|nr:hypothetical protein B0J11DRAFT_154712 [Dendryphion nanum]